MAMIEQRPASRPLIDLAGPDGNAYVLMGLAARYSKELGLDQKPILADMQSGNYKHLVEVFEKHFGLYVDLLLPEGGL